MRGARASQAATDKGTRTAAANVAMANAIAAAVASGARAQDLPAADTFIGSREEILADLTDWLQPGDWVLVKGSRGMAMEKVVEVLKAWPDKK